MNNKFSKIIIAISSTLFVLSGILFGKSCFTPNILSQIGESKIYGAIDVPELDDCLSGWRDEWEWMTALETFGALDVEYNEDYLRKNVEFVSLLFSMILLITVKSMISIYMLGSFCLSQIT